jgi:hypothetical protein
VDRAGGSRVARAVAGDQPTGDATPAASVLSQKFRPILRRTSGASGPLETKNLLFRSQPAYQALHRTGLI